MSNQNTTFLGYNPIPDNVKNMIRKVKPSNIRNYMASKIATDEGLIKNPNVKLSEQQNANANANANDNANANANANDNEKKEPNFGKFVGYTILSILSVIVYFMIGGMFLEYANFYRDWKMTGRFPDKPPYTTNFPYVNTFTKSSNPDEDNLIYRFFNWITQGFIHGFSSSRFYLDKFLDYSGIALEDSPDFVTSIVMLFAPLVIVFGIAISPLIGGVNTFVGLIENGGLIIPDMLEFILMALPLLIPLIIYIGVIFTTLFTTSFGVGIVQSFMLAIFLLIMPLFNKKLREGTINKMLNNKYLIILTGFIFVTVSAFSNLDKTYGFVTLGMSLAALLVFIFMKFF